MYYGAEGNSPKERINSIRRAQYQLNKDYINVQNRDAYQAKIFAEQKKSSTVLLEQSNSEKNSQSDDIYNPFENRDSQDGFTDHTKKRQRKEERNISDQTINSVVKNPLHKSGVIIDEKGRPYVEYIGKKVTVINNPDNGAVVTVIKTPPSVRRKWEKKKKGYQ
ncbi:MAG: hypothetical protein IKS37_11485 [Solobacterium sp.]|nr:hypothetical protein [Solobacterium sp.]